MGDDDTDLGWRDPYVVIGAIALVAVFVVVIWALITGQFHHNSNAPSTPRGQSLPSSGSERPAPTGKLPYPTCAAAARDGRRNIHIGDPAYNPALDRNHDGIACGRAEK